jgi:hypothetical protein
MNKIFGYEPVAIFTALQTILVMLIEFGKLDFIGLNTTDDAAIVVAVVAAIEAVVVAYETKQTLLAPIMALVKAALALGFLYGFKANPEQVATLYAAVQAVVLMLQRQNTDATREEAGSFVVA